MEADGWKGRFGVILPADNVVFEPEVYDLRLEGIAFHAVRLLTIERTHMPASGIECSVIFNELGVDVVGYACAETSFLGGEDTNRTICEGITARTSLPAVTATQAMVEALRDLQVSRVALAVPYRATSANALVSYLEQAGIRVVHRYSRDFSEGSTNPREWYDTNRQPVSTAEDLARQADAPEAEAVFIAGTNLPTLAAVQRLEEALGKPVVTSNSALVWAMLRRHGLAVGSLRLGRLAEIGPAVSGGDPG